MGRHELFQVDENSAAIGKVCVECQAEVLAVVFLILTLDLTLCANQKCAFGQARIEFDISRPLQPIEQIDAVRAIQVVKEEVPFSMQSYYFPMEFDRRLSRLNGERNRFGPLTYSYSFSTDDDEAWTTLLLDESADEIARMCAAIFLYEGSMDAHGLLSERLESADLDTRLNAAMALAVIYDRRREAGILEELAALMNDLFVGSDWESFEAMGLNVDKKGHFFLKKVASLLAMEQVNSLLPALLVIAEREEAERKFAVTRIHIYQTEEACELMLGLMKSGKYGAASMAKALASHGYVKAIPEIANLLGTDLEKNSLTDNQAKVKGLEQSVVLSALLKLKAKTTVPQIQQFIDSGKFPDQIPQAERLIIHLSSDDPVTALLARIDPADRTPRSTTIISELRMYSDPGCLKKFGELARTSASFWTRTHSLIAISEISGDHSLLLLADLLDVIHPDNLETSEPHKARSPGELSGFLRGKTRSLLRQRTGQDFGRSPAKWRAWIKANPGK